MRHLLYTCALALSASLALLSGRAEAWWVQLESDTILQSTRWRGARPEPIDRTDMRQRLRLEATQPQDKIRLVADLEVGADLGPEADLAAQQLGDGRTALAIYEARLSVRDVVRRVDLEVGRAASFGPLGLRVVDGLGVETRWIPFARLKGQIGIAPRQGWSDVGPEIFEGVGASTRPGYRASLGVASRGLRRLHLAAAWAKDFDQHTQAEEAGASAALTVYEGWARRLILHARGVYAALIEAPSVLEAEARYEGPYLSARTGWRRHQPVFSADSIWNAFGALPYAGLHGAVTLNVGAWRLALDGLTRHFEGDTDMAALPGLPYSNQLEGGLGEIAPPQVNQSFDVGAGVTRAASIGQLGLSGRGAWGDLGRRQLGQAWWSLPSTVWGQAAGLTARAGGLRVERPEGAALTWWGVTEISWRGGEHWRLDGRCEGAHDPLLGARLSGMLRLRLEDLW